MRETTHLTGNHSKTTSLLTSTRSFDCSVQRQNIRLKSNAVDNANDLAHAPSVALNGLDRMHGMLHGRSALVSRSAEGARARIVAPGQGRHARQAQAISKR